MKLNRGTALVLFVLWGVANVAVGAQVPDNIDHEKYLQVYQNLKKTSESLRNTAEETAKKARNIENNISQHQKMITDLGREKQGNIQTVAQYRQDIPQHQADIKKLEKSIDQININLKESQRQLSQLSDQKFDLQLRLSAAVDGESNKQREYSRIERELEGVNVRISGLESKIQQQQDSIEGYNSRIKTKKQQITNIEERITALGRDKTNDENNIVQTKRKRTTSQTNLDREEASLRETESKISIAERRRNEIAGNPDFASELQTLDRQLSELRNQKNRQRNRVNELGSEVRTFDSDIVNLENSIRSLENRIRSQGLEKDDLLQDISQQEISINQLERLIRDDQQSLSSVKSEKSSLESKLSRAKRDLEQASKVVRDLKQNEQNILNQIAKVESNIRDQQGDMTGKQNQIQDHFNQINNKRTQISTLEARILEIDKRIPQVEAARDQLKKDLVPVWERYKREDQVASQAESKTRVALEKHQVVKANYEGLLADADQQGQAYGDDHGALDGTPNGQAAGIKVGAVQGQDKGKADGLEDGFQRGSTVGDEQGIDAGYKSGLNAPENFQRGYQLGAKSGKERAYAEAYDTSYKEARRKRRNELLAVAPRSLIALNNGTNKSLLQPERFVSSGFRSVEGLSWSSDDNELDQPIRFSNQVCKKNEQPGLIEVPNSTHQVDCNLGYIDFVNKCVDSYKKSYAIAYEMAYTESYVESRKGACQTSYDQAFAQHKNDRFEQARVSAYQDAYRQWEEVGAKEAEKKGYEQGSERGYDDYIATAKSEEYSRGLREESQYFASNPVVTLVDAKIEPADRNTSNKLVAGKLISINLTLTNHGSIGSKPGDYEVYLESLNSNVQVENKYIDVTGVPARTKAQISGVGLAKINPNSLGKHELSLMVTVVSNKYNYKERTYITAYTESHLTSSAEIASSIFSTPTEPRIGREQDIRIKIVNEGRFDARINFTGVLSAPSLRANQIEFVKNTLSYGNLRRGESETERFKYVVKDARLKGKKVPITFTMYYNGNVSGVKTFIVVPK